MSGPVDTDVLIIGAGPVGLFAVFMLGMQGLSCHLVDSQDRAGGQCVELYPEKPIYDIPGYPEILAGDLVARLGEQIRPFQPTFHFNQMVRRISGDSRSGFEVTTDHNLAFHAKVVVIAAGGGAFQPRRAPIKGVEAYEGHSVFYAVRKRADFSGHDVVVVGGGDSALDWALSLGEIARSVTLVHRRDEFRAHPHSVAAMRDRVSGGHMRLMLGQVAALEGEDGQLSGLTVKGMDGGMTRIPATRMLPFFGLSAQLGPIADWGLALHDNKISVDPAAFQTSIPGIFAIGDICHYPGKLTLILSGFHEAALMTQAAKAIASPGETVLFQHSTGSSILHDKLAAMGGAQRS